MSLNRHDSMTDDLANAGRDARVADTTTATTTTYTTSDIGNSGGWTDQDESFSQKTREAGHHIADKSREVGHAIVDKTREAGHAIADKSREAGHAIADKSREISHKISDSVSGAKNEAIEHRTAAGESAYLGTEQAGIRMPEGSSNSADPFRSSANKAMNNPTFGIPHTEKTTAAELGRQTAKGSTEATGFAPPTQPLLSSNTSNTSAWETTTTADTMDKDGRSLGERTKDAFSNAATFVKEVSHNVVEGVKDAGHKIKEGIRGDNTDKDTAYTYTPNVETPPTTSSAYVTKPSAYPNVETPSTTTTTSSWSSKA